MAYTAEFVCLQALKLSFVRNSLNFRRQVSQFGSLSFLGFFPLVVTIKPAELNAAFSHPNFAALQVDN